MNPTVHFDGRAERDDFRDRCDRSVRALDAMDIGPGKVVVTVFADKGEHYLSTDIFNRQWTQNSQD